MTDYLAVIVASVVGLLGLGAAVMAARAATEAASATARANAIERQFSELRDRVWRLEHPYFEPSHDRPAE